VPEVAIVVMLSEPDAPLAVPPFTTAETVNVPPAVVVSPTLNQASPLLLKLAAVSVSVETPEATSVQVLTSLAKAVWARKSVVVAAEVRTSDSFAASVKGVVPFFRDILTSCPH